MHLYYLAVGLIVYHFVPLAICAKTSLTDIASPVLSERTGNGDSDGISG